MPALHLPGAPAELIVLAAVLAGFGAFVITLLGVSISVTLAQRAEERPVERQVTPAARARARPALDAAAEPETV